MRQSSASAPYTGVVTDAELRRVTVDYTLEFARVLRAGSPTAAFSSLSGEGADQTGQSRIAFARYKGVAEKAPRKEPNLGYRLLRSVYPVFRVLFPNQVVRADNLAGAMVDVAVRDTAESGGVIFENRAIRAMAKA